MALSAVAVRRATERSIAAVVMVRLLFILPLGMQKKRQKIWREGTKDMAGKDFLILNFYF